MKFLADVNLLVALGHTGHVHHARATNWLMSLSSGEDSLATCSITEVGFVRISVQAGLQPDVAAARSAFSKMKRSSPIRIELLADAVGVDRMPAYVKKPSQLTDGHLLELAHRSNAAMATLDAGIPGSVLVP